MSGELDIAVGDDGTGLVRYRDTDTRYTIGNLEDRPPLLWTSVEDLAAAIAAAQGLRDAAGNRIPFEA
ncbi:hypothetical protein [Nocardia crassostreae]|uniref:hypothetical protein n=1 Tax=Nocardia crassostreae TaxID=53428 RepID=UPI001FDFACB7|nr:hypothetical protein [Nocardia crassostreae]